MQLSSSAWPNGGRIPTQYAAGKRDADTVCFSDDLSPPLEWSDAPEGTKSFVLLVRDLDVPSCADDVNQPDREVRATLPRVEFFHWVLVDLPAGVVGLAEGEGSTGFVPRGKRGPAGPHGARQGLNDYTGWFASDSSMSGPYHGYDGPFPPFNDTLVHRYVFTLYALDIERLAVEGSFTGADVVAAMAGHVLAEASFRGSYTLNARLV